MSISGVVSMAAEEASADEKMLDAVLPNGVGVGGEAFKTASLDTFD